QARPGAHERVAAEPTLLHGLEQEARGPVLAQAEIGPEGCDEIGGDDGDGVHVFGPPERKRPGIGSASGAGCRLAWLTLPRAPARLRACSPSPRRAGTGH